MKIEDLKNILELHAKYLAKEPGGVRADLCGADLCGANLYGADLCGADLCGADLCGANLYGADLYGADLRGADLRGADLCGADLRSADLRSANLCGANLPMSRGLKFAQVSWSGHGECGRQMSAVELPDGLRLFCGCFQGTPQELADYIANGAEEHKASRTKAMNFILSCF